MNDLTTLINASLANFGAFHMTVDGFISSPIEIPQGASFRGNGHTLGLAPGASLTLANGSPSLGPSLITDLTIRRYLAPISIISSASASPIPVGLTVESNSFRLQNLTIGDRGAAQNDGFPGYDFTVGLRLAAVDPINGPASVQNVSCFNYQQFGILMDRGNDYCLDGTSCQSRAWQGALPVAPIASFCGGLVLRGHHSWGMHQYGDILAGDGFLLSDCQHESSNCVQLVIAASKGRIVSGAFFLAPACFLDTSWSKAEGIWLGLDDAPLAAIEAAGVPPMGSGGWVADVRIDHPRIGNQATSQGQNDQTFPSGVVLRVSAKASRSEVVMRVPNQPEGTPVVGDTARIDLDVKTTDGQAVAVPAVG